MLQRKLLHRLILNFDIPFPELAPSELTQLQYGA